MRKIIVLITISFVILSCLRGNLKTNSNTKFQQFIGTEKTNALHTGINEFENWLNKRYGSSNVSENYIKYLNDIIENGYEENVFHCSSATKKIIRNSGLIYDFYDTVFNTVIIDSIYLEYHIIPGNIETKEFIPIINYIEPGMNFDSIINADSYSVYFNFKGKYYQGIVTYGDKKLLDYYLSIKENESGWVSPLIIADILKQPWIDYNDFIIKSIVFHELCIY